MEDRSTEPPTYSEDTIIVQIAKYWGHGILYSILTTIAFIPILTMLLFLTLLIGIIGLVLGIALMFLAIGWINKMIAGFIWKIECRGAWQSLIGHGVGLFAGLLVVAIPLLFVEIMFYYSPLLYLLISYGPVPIIHGGIAKYVATYFEEGGSSESGPYRASSGGRTPKAPMTTCPYCNAVFPYREIDLSLEGTAPCRTCGAIIQDPRYGSGGPRRVPRTRGVDPTHTRPNDDDIFTSFESDSTSTRNLVTCPFCGHKNERGSIACHNCGSRL